MYSTIIKSFNEIAIQMEKLFVKVPSKKCVFQILYVCMYDTHVSSLLLIVYLCLYTCTVYDVRLYISKTFTSELNSFARDHLPVLTP